MYAWVLNTLLEIIGENDSDIISIYITITHHPLNEIYQVERRFNIHVTSMDNI